MRRDSMRLQVSSQHTTMEDGRQEIAATYNLLNIVHGDLVNESSLSESLLLHLKIAKPGKEGRYSFTPVTLMNISYNSCTLKLTLHLDAAFTI